VNTAVVVDEFGTIQGIVTRTDLLEAVAGDLPDVDVGSDPKVTRRSDGSLLIDAAILFACIVLREFIFAVGSGATADIASEGLLIVGWVAMWRPLEIFVYDWRPIRRRCQVFAKLSEMPVIVRAA
jgi:CBS domain-containing protein